MRSRSHNLVELDGKGLRFLWLLAFLLLVALTGGGSRSDIVSLVVLRPVAVLCCVAAAWSISAADLRRYGFAFLLFSATMGLTFLHLVPLPPSLWSILPGHALIAVMDTQTGIGSVWRPLSISPPDTRNALFSLFVPLAVLLLGAQLPSNALRRLLFVLVAIGLASAVLGLLQMVGPPTGPLLLYRHTNYGNATGLFANRNHQAVFLATLLPMLATLVSTGAHLPHAKRNTLAALAAGLFLVPLLLITGSRAGILLGALGLASVPLLLRARVGTGQPRTGSSTVRRFLRSRAAWVVGAGLLVVALAGVTITLSRAESVRRLLEVGADEELRFKVWPVIVATIPTYFPFGSGVGSFVEAFQVVEPDRILRPTYLNHAHNDLLEIALTAGLPGLALLLVSIGGWIVAARRAFAASPQRDEMLFARLGLIVIAILALGSIGDYPLRTPFLAVVLVVAVLWCSGTGDRSAKQPVRRYGSGDPLPESRVQGSIS